MYDFGRFLDFTSQNNKCRPCAGLLAEFKRPDFVPIGERVACYRRIPFLYCLHQHRELRQDYLFLLQSTPFLHYTMPWLSHLNPIPAFPAYTGPYKVGTIDVEFPVSELQPSSFASPDPSISTIAFRIFYPGAPSSATPSPVNWLQSPQQSYLSAYARFLGVSPGFSNIISYGLLKRIQS